MEIRSSYQKKNLKEIEYTMYEHCCRICGHWFLADDGFFYSAPSVEQEDRVKYYCPYCGAKQYECI